MVTTSPPANPAHAAQVVLVDALLPSCQKQLAGREGASVSIRGIRAHLFIGGKKFRCLKDSLSDVRRSLLPDGSIALELDLGSSAYESDAGTLRVLFPAPAALSAEAAWAIAQFENDAKLALSYARPDRLLVQKKSAPASAVQWLEQVSFWGGKKANIVYEHPEPMLEPKAVQAVRFPDLGGLQLSLPAELVTRGVLSFDQMQAVCYAARSFKSFLPGDPRAGGFLLGDGTGCGKGRVIATLLAHVATRPPGNTRPEIQAELARRRREGRARRCVWVSLSRDLVKDAERDLSDVAAEATGLRLCDSLEKGAKSDPNLAANVLFITYAKLRNERHAKDVVAWLGGELAEGLIVFDEAHAAKNYANGRGSSTKQGQMVDYLQSACPLAPVLYASATACTEVFQLAYMTRLGLWGPGRKFSNFSDFKRDVESRGLAGMEAIAVQLKSMGVATSRSLSHDGTSLEIVNARAESERVASYDRACEFWCRMQSEAEAAIAEMSQYDSGIDCAHLKQKCGGFWKAFWACQLRFFQQLVVSQKVPEVKRRVEKALEEQDQAVVTLWGTGEAQLAEAAQADEVEDGAPPSCPEIMLDQFITRNFPCPPDGHIRTLLLTSEEVASLLGRQVDELSEQDVVDLTPEVDEMLRQKARLVWCLPAQAPLKLERINFRKAKVAWSADFTGATSSEARRAALRSGISSLELPQHPLDELLHVLGGPSQVAELSGRSHRLSREEGGRWQVVPRQGTNIQEQHAFQYGSKRTAIITEAASTGISLHSDRRRAAIGFMPRRRTLLMVELGFSAEKTMQQLGRVHRANQAFPPRFEIILSPVPGEARLAFALARKLKSLGAVTRGDQHGAGSSFFGDQDFGQALSILDVPSKQAAVVLEGLAKGMRESQDASDRRLAESLVRLGMDDIASGGDSSDKEWGVNQAMTRFLGRCMMLPIKVQQDMFSRLRHHSAAEISGDLHAPLMPSSTPSLPACETSNGAGDHSAAKISGDLHAPLMPSSTPSLPAREISNGAGDHSATKISGDLRAPLLPISTPSLPACETSKGAGHNSVAKISGDLCAPLMPTSTQSLPACETSGRAGDHSAANIIGDSRAPLMSTSTSSLPACVTSEGAAEGKREEIPASPPRTDERPLKRMRSESSRLAATPMAPLRKRRGRNLFPA